MGLISRSSLLRTIYKNCKLTEGVKDVLEQIKEFPESYDVEYVIDELEKYLEYASSVDTDSNYESYKDGISDALRIVKKGWIE